MWQYLSSADSAFFLWMTSCAQDWDFNDFVDMVKQTENDTFYGYFFNGECQSILRIKWIVQPYSGYFWIWIHKKFRKTEIVRTICSSILDLFKKKLKTQKVIAICVDKSIARLCKRFEGEIKTVLPDLYWKGKDAYVVYWNFGN